MTELLPTTIQSLKSADPDRYRSALMADQQGRLDLLTLYSFHYELAKVPDVTSEPMMGEIRYQWWRDAIEEIYSGKAVRRHEVATPLSELISRRKLSRFHVDQLIDGRARDLDPTPFENLDEAKAYCRQTSGVLMQLGIACLGADGSEPVDAGEAWGMTGLARAYGFYHDRILSELDIETLIASAEGSYEATKAGMQSIGPNAMPAIAYIGLIPGFLKRMRSSGFDPQTQRVNYGPIAKQFKLFRIGLTGRL